MTQFKNRAQTALVWGARGFIGRALVTHLHAAGWRVRTLTRSLAQERPWPDDVACVELPGHDRLRAFSRALDGVSVVFNLAGSSGAVTSNHHPIDSLESNCRVQLEFLAACERAADRSGLVACGDIGVAIRAAGGVERARHLVELAATQRYLASQRRLRRVQ